MNSPRQRDTGTRIGLGTVQFGMPYGITNHRGHVTESNAAAILDLATAHGLTMLDTAADYGTAEQVLNGLLHDRPAFRVVTKTAALSAGLSTVEATARRSLALLGTERLHALLVHRAGDLLSHDGAALWRCLEVLRDELPGLKLGISAYDAAEIEAVIARFPIELVQVPVNLLDQRLLRDGTLDKLKTKSIEIHARSVFLQGLLAMKCGEMPAQLPAAVPALGRIDDCARDAGTTRLGLALRFILTQETVDVAIIGVTSAEELSDIIQATEMLPGSVDFHSLSIVDPAVIDPRRW